MTARRATDRTVVRLTLAEASALRDATGFGRGEPTSPRELAALDRALDKIERAQQNFRRARKAL